MANPAGIIRDRAVVVALDKFKGTLDAPAACNHLAAGLVRGDAELSVRLVPIADGGEGSVAAAVRAGFTAHSVPVTGPTGRSIDATFATRGQSAVIEAAEACGLHLVAPDRIDPMVTTTYGVGELLQAALTLGCTDLVLGLGGTATVDGGIGMLTALGARCTDEAGDAAPGGARGLSELTRVDLTTIDDRLRTASLVLATDVDNPLLGGRGAARVFGPQKGADAERIETLERGMRRFVDTLPDAAARLATEPGAGAAGGLGFAGLLVGGTLRPGGEIFLDLLDFDDAVSDAELMVTGEGRLDDQTLHGKAPARAAARAREHGVPAIAVAGSCTLSPAELEAAGFIRAFALTDIDPRCVTDAALTGRLLERIGEQLAATFTSTTETRI